MRVLLDATTYSQWKRGHSRIAVNLRRKGRPIPTNDIWIAAHAMESGADLVSADRHFEEVDGLAWTLVA